MEFFHIWKVLHTKIEALIESQQKEIESLKKENEKLKATLRQRKDEEVRKQFNLFLNERTATKEGESSTLQQIYRAYRNWALGNSRSYGLSDIRKLCLERWGNSKDDVFNGIIVFYDDEEKEAWDLITR